MSGTRYVGNLQNGDRVKISSDSPNKSIVISGISGTGKSQRICDLEKNIIAEGSTVIVLDLDGSHYNVGNENIISAREDGIALNFLDVKILNKPSDEISEYQAEIANLLLSVTKAGDRQRALLRDTILWALKHKNNFENDFSAIETGLEEIGTEKVLGVRDKIWPLLKCRVFRESKKTIQKGKVNVISFESFDTDLTKVLVEIFLKNLWKEARKMKENKITVVIDEFQNLILGRKSSIEQILREGRKYGVDMVLATQTLATFSKETLVALNQAAVRLYFRPAVSEARILAQQIDGTNVERMILQLKHLKIGESIAIGDLEIAGRRIGRPIIVKTDYKTETGYCIRRASK